MFIESIGKLAYLLEVRIRSVVVRRKVDNRRIYFSPSGKNSSKAYLVDSTGRHFVKKTDYEVVREVVQEEYENWLIELDRKVLDHLHEVERILKEEELMNEFGEIRRSFIKPIPLVTDEYVRRWMAMKPNPAHYVNPFGRKYPTDHGELVRSKSEVIIANRLNKEPYLAYKYEFPVALPNGGYRVPDFTILNRNTGEVFYLEHFGMMDDPKYRNGAFDKLDDYAKVGIFFGRNLLVTFEANDREFNMVLLESYIKYVLT